MGAQVQVYIALLLALMLLLEIMKKHYIEIDNDSGKILCFSHCLSLRPNPIFTNSTVYDVESVPENFTHYIEGMVFDPGTKALSHSKDSFDFYKEVIEKLNYRVNCCT